MFQSKSSGSFCTFQSHTRPLPPQILCYQARDKSLPLQESIQYLPSSHRRACTFRSWNYTVHTRSRLETTIKHTQGDGGRRARNDTPAVDRMCSHYFQALVTCRPIHQQNLDWKVRTRDFIAVNIDSHISSNVIPRPVDSCPTKFTAIARLACCRVMWIYSWWNRVVCRDLHRIAHKIYKTKFIIGTLIAIWTSCCCLALYDMLWRNKNEIIPAQTTEVQRESSDKFENGAVAVSVSGSNGGTCTLTWSVRRVRCDKNLKCKS